MTAPVIGLERPRLEPGSVEWATGFITASKVPGIFNATKHSSPTKEFYLLRGEVPPDEENDAMVRGTELEPGILSWFFRDHPQFERIGTKTFVRPGLEEWAAANPDDIAVCVDTLEAFGVEAKTDGRGDYQWGKPGTDQVPLGYYLQVQWQMHMSGHRRTYVTKLGPFLERDDYIVDYDAELAASMEVQLHAFWLNAKDPNGKPPELDGKVHTYDAIRRAHPEIEQHLDWPISLELAHEFEDALEAAEAAEEHVNLVKSKILRVMGNARRAIVGNPKKPQVVGNRQPTKKGVALYKMRNPIQWDEVDKYNASIAPDQAA
ncbi:YqaJ viral recombinase family protein [Rhodococcus maanshanensis]|uniref:YqaJ viral recombinase family protein n=1 Tax=Rhodococcus maanshanensis TaxID=183556 RepID=UPI0022B5C0FD|nr:YqaJ viral recombinase family protein [Rhodococcus maanshanensis]MCZ4557926.1 YqaJ viral recombinase family protein [Rhodococcus maanshanensis]